MPPSVRSVDPEHGIGPDEAARLAALGLRWHAERPGQLVEPPWTLRPIAAGANGIVLRAEGQDRRLAAVKLALRDTRERGPREQDALRAIERAGLPIAPRALCLRAAGGMSALVVTWVEAIPLAAMPRSGTPAAERLLALLVALHGVPASDLRPGVLHDGDQVLRDARRRARGAAEEADLLRVLDRAASALSPTPAAPRRSLLHVDANIANVLAAPDGRLWLVDFENAGAGDPCFDVADLCAHPSALALEEDQRERDWLVEAHAEALGDPRLAARTRGLVAAMLAWWIVRLTVADGAPRLAGTRGFDDDRNRRLLWHYRAWAERLLPPLRR